MPFDGVETVQVNRARLIEALREMPENFVWDLSKWREKTACKTTGCAVGLAIEIGLIDQLHWSIVPTSVLADKIGISRDQAREIFNPATFFNPATTVGKFTSPIIEGPFKGHYFFQVTSEMVADALEAIVK